MYVFHPDKCTDTLTYIYYSISKRLQCALTAITIVALWQLPHLGHGMCAYTLFGLHCDIHYNQQPWPGWFTGYQIACLLPAGRHWLKLGSNPAGFEFRWQSHWRIWPCLVSDWLAGGLNEQTQPTTRLACSNGHECYKLGNDCIHFKLSHKPGVAGLNCGGWQYDKRKFTICF